MMFNGIKNVAQTTHKGIIYPLTFTNIRRFFVARALLRSHPRKKREVCCEAAQKDIPLRPAFLKKQYHDNEQIYLCRGNPPPFVHGYRCTTIEISRLSFPQWGH